MYGCCNLYRGWARKEEDVFYVFKGPTGGFCLRKAGGAKREQGGMAAAVSLAKGGSTHRGVHMVTMFGNLSKLEGSQNDSEM